MRTTSSRPNQTRLEQFRHQLQREQDEERRARDARELVAHYRGPLLRTAFDFQSRLYNMLGPNNFRGDGDDYFRRSTLFVIGSGSNSTRCRRPDQPGCGRSSTP